MKTVDELNEMWEKCAKGPMSELENSGDGKCARMSAGDGYWEDFNLEVDTDDCQYDVAINSAEFVRELWNSWPEISKILSK